MRGCGTIVGLFLFTSSIAWAQPHGMSRLLSSQGEALCNPCLFTIKGQTGGQLRMRTKDTPQGAYIYQVDFFPNQAKAFRIHRESLNQEAIPASEAQAYSVDLNKDGYQDIAVLVSQGSQGQRQFRYWLFDPKSKSHRPLSLGKKQEFTELKSSSKKNYLVAQIRNSGLNTEKIYKLKGHRLKLVKSRTSDHRVPTSLLKNSTGSKNKK